MKTNQSPKRQKLSKAELALQTAQKQEAEKFKTIIREGLFPLLQEHTDSIIHAQQVCEIFKTVIASKMNQYWIGKTVADLGLDEELTKDESVADRELYEALTEALNEVSLSDAQKLLQGMGGALDGYVREMAKETKMKDVPIEKIIAV